MRSSPTARDDAALIRTTVSGKIEGKRWDDAALAWLGIPYAKPPIGALRWRAPRDPDSWEGVRPAQEFASECVQYGGLLLGLDPETFGEPTGSEDCLYLNVWRPATQEQDLPVILYLHGGLNVVGEGATSLYHGANLANSANVIVVTINYRLGVFGWFAHEALETGDALDDSGNYGLLDIIKSLEWAQRNIGSFGGDANNVTLAGESAGAYNIVSLLASPLSRGLFHRALAISPLTSLMSTSMRAARKRADKLFSRLVQHQNLAANARAARSLASDRGNTWTARYLRALDASDLLRATRPLTRVGLNSLGLTLDTFGGSRFLDGTVLPLDFKACYQRGNHHRVPLIIGSTSDEMRIFELGLRVLTKLSESELCQLIQSFDPDEPTIALAKFLPRHLVPFYALIGSTLGSRLFEKTGVDVCADLIGRHTDVYVFKFCWADQPAPFDTLVGASHMMPLPFLFGNFQTTRDELFRFAWSEANRAGREQLSRAMIAYVGNFVRSGDPNTGPGNDLLHWPAWSRDRGQTPRLIFDTPVSVR